MRKTVVVLAVLALVGSVASRAEAQFRFGANIDWGSKTDFGIGARGSFGLGKAAKNQPIEGLVTFDYFFPSGINYWELSGNGIYRFTVRESSVAPYAGAGQQIAHSSVKNCPTGYSGCGSTDAGLNLIGGLRFKGGPNFLPFVEGRVEARSGSQLVLTAGAFFGKP